MYPNEKDKIKGYLHQVERRESANDGAAKKDVEKPVIVGSFTAKMTIVDGFTKLIGGFAEGTSKGGT